MNSFKSILMWIWFSVFISLLPLAYNAWAYFTQPIHCKDLLDCLQTITANGELLLICVALTGALMGELLLYPQSSEIGRIIIGGSCFICTLFSIMVFAHIWITSINNIDKNINDIFRSSYRLFAITLFFGIATKIHTVHSNNKIIDGGK